MNLPLQMGPVFRGRSRRLSGLNAADWSGTVTPTADPRRGSQGVECYCDPKCWAECCRVGTCPNGTMKCTCAGNNTGFACCDIDGSCICTGNMPGCGS